MPRPLSAGVLAATGGEADAVRHHILEAAHQVMARDGLSAASTRAIAEEAGLGAGTLYNYFENRTQLLARAILWRATRASAPLASLPARAGTETVAANLVYFARWVSLNLEEVMPLIAAAFSDRPLLDALRREMEADSLLDDIRGALRDYLLAEQELGRVAPTADCDAAAATVFSLCHDRAFQRYAGGEPGEPEPPMGQIAFIAAAVTSGAPLHDGGSDTPARPAERSRQP